MQRELQKFLSPDEITNLVSNQLLLKPLSGNSWELCNCQIRQANLNSVVSLDIRNEETIRHFLPPDVT